MRKLVASAFWALLLFSGLADAATQTWTGAGATANWSDAANWSGGIAPATGDRLQFPAGAARFSSINDISNGSFDGFDVGGSGYVFAGNAVTLTGSPQIELTAANAALELRLTARLENPNGEIRLPGSDAVTTSASFTVAPIGSLIVTGGTVSLNAGSGHIDVVGPITTDNPYTGVLQPPTVCQASGRLVSLFGDNFFGCNRELISTAVVLEAGDINALGSNQSLLEARFAGGLRIVNDTAFIGKFVAFLPGGNPTRLEIPGPNGIDFVKVDFSGTTTTIVQDSPLYISWLEGSGTLIVEGGSTIELDAGNQFQGIWDLRHGTVDTTSAANRPSYVIGDDGTWRSHISLLTDLQCFGTLSVAAPDVFHPSLDANGSVNVGGCNLVVNFPTSEIPGSDTVYTLILANGPAVAGNFAGLPEGAIVKVNDVDMAITYKGINGKSVALHKAPPPPPPPPPIRVMTMGSPTGTGLMTLEITNGGGPNCGLVSASFVDAQSVGPAVKPPPASLQFLHGVVIVQTENCTPGDEIEFVLGTPSFPDDARLYLLESEWRPTAGGLRAGESIAFSILDGGATDIDGLANGALKVAAGIAIDPQPNYQDMWWAGPAENGWGMSIVQHRDVLFSVIYAYDAAGRPTWYVMPGGTWNAARTAFTGPLYLPRGTPFFNYNASQLVPGTPVGNATIGFSDRNSALLEFTISGIAGHKAITRQLFGPQDVRSLGNRTDMWWGGTLQNGWGIAVLQQGASLFSVWFSYDAAGAPTWFVMPAGIWTDPNTLQGDLYRTLGSGWLGQAYNPAMLQPIDVGSFRLRFSGESATLDYVNEGRSGTLPLVRQGF